MADAPKHDFGKRRPVSVPPSPAPPAKRSNHVALLVMGTLAVGGTAYALMPRECTPAQPGTSGSWGPAECPPRSSSSSSGGSTRYSYYSGGSSTSRQTGTADASSSSVRRGGFGGFARSFSSHFSFGS
jgi:hypothetical protein